MNINISRHNARRYALQALYQWNFTQDEPTQLIRQFFDDHPLEDTDVDYFSRLVTETIRHCDSIDELMKMHLDRKISALNPVELAIMRTAICELSYCLEIPYKVVIDEALELTKEFGAQEGYKYVNAVLDAVAKKIRKGEK